MGIESLDHSERAGNKFKRIVASGALVGGLVAGVGVDKVVSIPEAFANQLPPEASANQLPAEQFWVGEFTRLMSEANSYRPNSVNSPSIASQKGNAPGSIPGTWLYFSNSSIISKDKTTEISINYSVEVSSKNTPLTTVNDAKSRFFNVDLYYGKNLNPKDNPNALSSYYNLEIANVLADGKYPHWLLTLYTVHFNGSKNSGYYLKEGTVITNNNQILSSEKMSQISSLVGEAILYIGLVEKGRVLRPSGMYGEGSYATVAYSLVPPK